MTPYYLPFNRDPTIRHDRLADEAWEAVSSEQLLTTTASAAPYSAQSLTVRDPERHSARHKGLGSTQLNRPGIPGGSKP